MRLVGRDDLNPATDSELVGMYSETGDEKYLIELTERHIQLVRKIYSQVCPSWLMTDAEINAVALSATYAATIRYCSLRGAKFSSVLSNEVKGQLSNFTDSRMTLIRLPSRMKKLIKRTVNSGAVQASDIGVSEKVFSRIKSAMSIRTIDSMEIENIQESKDNQDDGLIDELADVVGLLPEKKRRIIEMRFGMSGHPPMTMAEIGDEMGVSAQAINKSINKILRELKKILNSRNHCIYSRANNVEKKKDDAMTGEERNTLAALTILGWKKDGDHFLTSKGKKADKAPNFYGSVPEASKLLQRVCDDLKLNGKVSFNRTADGYQCIFTSDKIVDKADGKTVSEALTEICLSLAMPPKAGAQ